jgi:hypothetical protein
MEYPDFTAAALHERGLPGKDGRGISLNGFLKAFPDEQACLEFLFWVRGGPALTCRLCGRPTRWIDCRHGRLFRSNCCATTVSATRQTLFYQSRIPLWDRLYAIMLTLNLSASPSVGFLARHLDVTENTAWNLLRKMREQFSLICVKGSRCLRGQTVAVQHVRFRKMQTARGRHTFTHSVVNHSRKMWVNEGGNSTSQIESVWRMAKRLLAGRKCLVSEANLWKFLGEVMYRYNTRSDRAAGWWRLIGSFPPVDAAVLERARREIDLCYDARIEAQDGK